MRTPFSISKFRELLVAGCVVTAMDFLVRISDSVIGGNLIGEEALAGIGLVSPILSLVVFVSGLLGTGTGVNCSMAYGRSNRTRAWQFFTQGLWSSLIFGGLLALAIGLCGNRFLASFGASPQASAYAMNYCRWMFLIAFQRPLVTFLLYVAYADGDTRICSLAYVLQFLSIATVSYVLVRLGLDADGLALGNVAGNCVALAVLGGHFFRKGNSFRLVRHFSLADSWTIVRTSFGDASSYLCDAVFYWFLCSFMIGRFGQDVMPETGAACTAFQFSELFIGIGVALQPLTSVYYGERNYKGVRMVIRSALRLGFVSAAVLSLAMIAWPEGVVRLVGIDSPENFADAVSAVRLCSIGISFYTVNCIATSYLVTIEHEVLSAVHTAVTWLLMPAASVAVFSAFGENGAWFGYGVSNAISLAFLLVYVRVRLGRNRFPLLLPKSRDRALHMFNLDVVERQIADVSRNVFEMLKASCQSERTVMHAALLAEEVLMVVKERNAGKRVSAEVSLDLNEGVTLTIRDDGKIFDITDADQQVSSLRTFLLCSLMEHHDDRMNLIVTGYNRNVFNF